MKLLVPISINILLVIAVYLLDKHTRFKSLPYMTKQVIIGIAFGGVACFASGFGVEVMNTVANIRDAAPLSAGLIFGAPSGIIAGVIGGVFRFFVGGDYTRIACTIATILAGLLAAALRKLMFDDKKPTWSYAIAITILCEVVHMLLIFLTNMGDSVVAFEFVRGATIPMIIGNVLAVGLAFVVITIISKEGIRRKKRHDHIAETFQRWLLVSIILAYLVTSIFTYILQNGMVTLETQELFRASITDVRTDVKGKSDKHLLGIVKKIKGDYETGNYTTLEALAIAYDVAEINVVNEDGLIIDSNEPEYINSFNMNDTEQSREFMVLIDSEKEEHVQMYGPIGIDSGISRKYAAMTLQDGGFIQVGYSANQFREILDEFVVDVTKNRHVGSHGFVAVLDERLKLVTELKNPWYGKHIKEIGILPDELMLAGESAERLMRATVTIESENYTAPYIYAYTFVEGYCILAAMPEEDAVFMRDTSLYTSVFMQVIVFATMFVFVYILIKRVIINNLNKVNSTLAKIADGNLNVVVDVRATEEFASLSDDINSTVDTLKRYIAEAAARIDKELEYAKSIQLGALPQDFPNEDEYAIYAEMIAAREVGGDFYDFYKINDDTVAFLAADVAGKGIGGALMMMKAKTVIKDLAESGMPINDVLTAANTKLCENNETGMFVTCWIGALNLTTGKLKFANAGHNPPLLKHGDGRFEFLRTRPGFVLGGMDGIRYRINEIDLAPGDRIFLYTDGVTEATDTKCELYGEDRLITFMRANDKLAATELLPLLKSDIDAFVGEADQFDDITILMLDYIPKANTVVKSRVFPAEVSALDDVLAFFESTLGDYDCPIKTQNGIMVAIEELFVNVSSYAYGEGKGDVRFTISFNLDDRTLGIRMADGGIPFDPLAKADPDITLSADEREIGGLGIFIVKKTMDTLTYTYENKENILKMTKKI